MITIFSNKSHYTKQFRKELMPMLRPFWKDQSDFTDGHRIAAYGEWVKNVKVSIHPNEAQLAVLPMSWNYYRQHNLQGKAIDFIETAKQAGLEILTWTSGDLGVEPLVKDVYVFRSSGYQSTRIGKQFAFPVFFSDPLEKYAQQDHPLTRPKGDLPVVGFCGQAYAPLHKNIYDITRTATRNLAYYLGSSPYEPQQLYPATLIRKATLVRLQNDRSIKTNFIIRKAYRAGTKSKEEKSRTTDEYHQNMIDSDYIVCVRGNGNFSARLYETMAMGRIPIIVNTDCVYPWDNELDWKTLGVWIDQDEIHSIVDKVSTFHRNISNEDFEKKQLDSRRIWVEYLSMSGFFSTLLNKFSDTHF